MSEIYLTKVERKTIFTQGLIFVLFTMLITDLSIVGPYIFTLIPWVFFLGIFGTVKFRQPVLTPFIVSVTAFMANLFKYDGLSKYAVISTLSMLLVSIIGVGVGVILRDFVLEHRLVKYLTLNRKIIYVVLIILAVILSFGTYIYLNGDIFGYTLAKNRLSLVMDECYLPDYEIVSTNHMYGFYGKYTFEIVVDNQAVTMYVDKTQVKEIHADKRYDMLNSKLDEVVLTLGFENSVKADYEFENTKLYPVNIIFELTSSDISNIDLILKDIEKCVNYKDEFGAYLLRIILTVEGKTQIIDKKDFEKINEQYIKDGMQIEELDNL